MRNTVYAYMVCMCCGDKYAFIFITWFIFDNLVINVIQDDN